MSALRALLSEVVDYAGLFPPAALPLPAVIKNYEEYVPSENNWMLARLILPAGRLSEFATLYQELFPNGLSQDAWLISALIPAANAPDDGLAKALQQIAQFNAECEFAKVDTVEGKLAQSDLIQTTCTMIPAGLQAFLEVPWQDPNDTIGKLAAYLTDSGRANTFAKIRTGSVTEDLIPSSERVANFIHACAAVELGMKATAGLHHPLRGRYPLTYQSAAEVGTMHGFMNVFLACCFANEKGWSQQPLQELLEDSNAQNFSCDETGISYKDQRVDLEEIQSTRRRFVVSFGSCSFTEPLQDLVALGWLADAAKTV